MFVLALCLLIINPCNVRKQIENGVEKKRINQ